MKQHGYNFRKAIFLYLVFCFMVSVTVVTGQTIYTGPSNGDWSTAANWSNGLPAIGNDPVVVGGAIVNINGNVTLNYAVTNFGTIISTGTTTLSGSINSGGAIENQGTFSISSGATMTSSGGFTNSGTLTNNGNVNSNSPLMNTSTGVFNNFSTWSQNGVATNNGIMSNKAGTFSCPSTFTNNKTVENLAGATWKVDFGGSFTNSIGSTLTNGGQFQNLGNFTNNTTITNSGTFTNNSILTVNGVFNNESGGLLESSATLNLSGRINNKLGATITSGFSFNILANGYVSNMAQFTNANMIDIAAGGTFCNETLSILTGQYGSVITNAGYFKVSSSSTATTNGSINNSRKIDIYGTYDAMGGGQINNSDSICNYGLIKNVNVINNSGVWKNFGTTENNSGGVWTNTNKIENNKGGLISNNYEIYNKPSATILNNGTFINNIRIFNEGTITNNAYFVVAGDFLNKTGGVLVNSEVFVIREGSIQNDGTVTNQKTLINEACSIITNRATGTINNTGRLENRGIIFQRGTLSGNAVLALGGHVQGAGSSAPSLCQTAIQIGTDATGLGKVYGQSGFKTGIGIDECSGFQYFANDVNRYLYTCPQVGQVWNTNFKIITRTGDSLTCTVPTTVFDNVSPVVSNCPTDATIYTTQNTATYSWPPVTGVDNCGDTPIVTESIASGSAFPIGQTKVTISVKDSHNNSTDCVFNLNVVKITTTATCPATDAAAPVFANCPANMTVNSNSSTAVVVWNNPSVTDNCYPVVVKQSLNSGTTFPMGTNTVTYTAKDPSGNVGTCSFTVTVNGVADICSTDPIKPVINCPANFFGTVNTAINGAVGYWQPVTASDNCGAAIITGTAVSGSIFNVGTTTVTYTATDAKNNTSTCSFTVNVAAANPCAGDVTGPVLTCPANVTVSTTSNTATATWATPTATDACAPVVLNGSHQSGSTFGVGTTTVTYSASDKVGNTSKCTFTVNVTNPCLTDTIAPVLSACPAGQTLTSTNGVNATATWTAPTATDNCALAGVTSNYASGSTFNIGTTNVVYTATDAKGKTSTCSFPITINISNVATCTGNIVLNQSFENNFANWTNTSNSATIVNDANSGAQAASVCGNNLMLKSQTYGKIGGTYTLTVRAKIVGATTGAFVGMDFLDAAGAVITTARVQQNVTATGYTTYTMTGVAPATAASIVVFAYKTGTAACLLVDDFCLTNPCSNDTQAPVFTGCPANQTVNISGTATTGVATWTPPVLTDNCSSPSIVNNYNPGTAFPIGTTTVTYSGTDLVGLKATCSFTVTVINSVPSNCTGGLVGCYFNNMTMSGAPALIRNEAVNFNWGSNAPDAVVNADNFSVRWGGQISAPVSGTYTFKTISDDGIRLWVNNQLLVDKWIDQSATSWTGTITLVAGQKYPIVIEYYENGGDAVVQLLWSYTGQAEQIVPTSYLCPEAPVSCAGNVISNFSFESDLSGFSDWGSNVITTDSHTGSKAVKSGMASGGFGYVTNVTPGSAISFSSWNKIAGAQSWAAVVGIDFFDANGVKTQVALGSITSTNYSQTTLTAVAPANARQVQVFAWINGTTGYLFTDDWCLTITDPCATDVIAPTFANCPANQSVTTTNNACKAVTWTAPTATDNCGTPSVTSTHTSGFCFPVGTTTVTYTATDAKANKSTCSFTVTVANTVTCSAPVYGKCYRIVNKLSGKVLGLAALNNYNNTYVNQYTYNDSPNFQWQFTQNSDGSYKIINSYSYDILACHSSTNGTRVYQWDNINDIAKYWKLENMGNCEYRIKNVYSGKYLDNLSSGSAEGSQIGIYSASGGADQLWKIEEVTCTQKCLSGGNIAVERWYSSNTNFPIILPTTSPNITVYQGNTQGPWNIGDNYTERVRGYICPKQTGNYQFNVTGDDGVELFVSTSSLAGAMRRVAYINGYTGETEYTKYASQTSSTITLQANQLYYFELRHSEGGGGDGWRISWKTPSTTYWQPIQSQFLARSCNTTYNSASQAIFEFNAKADYKVAKLQWVSNGGLNNDYYGVEKADDKGVFTQLGIVNAATLNHAPTVFDFIDENPSEGDNHYRIKTVDNNGNEKLSSIKTVNFKNLTGVKVFPNPVDDVLNIDLKSYQGHAVGVQLYNSLGKLVVNTQVDKASDAPLEISTSQLPVGSYFVRITPQGARATSLKVEIAR